MKSVAFVLLIGIMSCSSPIRIASTYSDSSVAIDGKSDDWTDVLQSVNDPNLLFGVRNDDRYLYFCFVPVDRPIGRQMLMRGFTVWFDPEGGKEKKLGVRFPLGLQEPIRESLRTGKNEDFMKNFDEKMLEQLREFEVLGPGEFDRQTLTRGEDQPIRVSVGLTEQGLVYELRFPLHSTGEFHGIDPSKTGIIGIGLQTEVRKGSGGMKRDGGGFEGGIGGGGMRGGRSGMGGPSGGMMREPPKPLDFWAKVKLGTNKS